MKIRASVALGIAFSLVCTGLRAQTIDWGAQVHNAIGTAEGGALPHGDLVLLGAFPGLTDNQIRDNKTDFSFLNSHFVQFGLSAVVGQNLNGNPDGYFAASASGSGPASTDSLGINGKPIYMWAFNSATASTATEWGIFNSTVTTPPPNAWIFPNFNDVPNTRSIDLYQVDNVVVGSLGPETYFGYPLYKLAPVPEPSAYGIVVGGLCLAGAGFNRLLRRK
jgi:hypothetical protein